MKSQALILKETARMNRFEFVPARQTPLAARYRRRVAQSGKGQDRHARDEQVCTREPGTAALPGRPGTGARRQTGGSSPSCLLISSPSRSSPNRGTPDRLAEVLGRYLHTATAAIQSQQGTIDKYIGDSVMALWNVPEEVPGHEILACRASLKCREALRELFRSPAWGDDPHFETRFGIHKCVASVGHFGAPDRFSYTTMGDGVNFASRLEGLNKYYGTEIVVSETVCRCASEHFHFRLLDCVAVMGKKQGITIYELVSEKAAGEEAPAFIARYEAAFRAYQRGEFAEALATLGDIDDGPGKTLSRRCLEFLSSPPEHWEGVWAFECEIVTTVETRIYYFSLQRFRFKYH